MKLSELQIEEDQISRILIEEDIEGNDVVVSIKKSSIISGDNDGSSISIDAGGHEHEDEIVSMVKTSAEAFLEQQEGIRSVELKLKEVRPENEDYLFNQAVLLLDSASVTTEEGEEAQIAQGRLMDLAPMFGFMSKPMTQPPACLLQALVNKDESLTKKICKQISKKVSTFGTFNHRPDYYAVLGQYIDKDEEGTRWRIA